MNIYAIIETGGKQERVTLGDFIRVEKLDIDGDKVTFDQVLLVQDGKTIQVGQPLVKGATVIARVIEKAIKGKKIRIFRYKAKSRYRKTQGHRQTYTDLQVIEIAGNKLSEKKAKSAPKKKPIAKKKPVTKKK